MKKILLTMSSIGAAAVPMISVIACSTSSSVVTTKEKIGLVAAEGTITDKSFNEQAWDALKQVNSSATSSTHVIETGSAVVADLVANYETMITSKGLNTIITPAFTQADAIKEFNKKHGTNTANFILVDSNVDAENVASIQFKTQEAGFLAGYLAASYLIAKGDTSPKVGMFGGGSFPSVTDFMVGVVNGVEHYNETMSPTTEVGYATLSTDEAYVNTGFKIGGGKATSKTLIANGADVLMAVAGPQTSDAAQAITEENKQDDVKLIGVDVDQSQTLTSYSDLFLTSILKEIETTTVNVINKISEETDITGINGYGETTFGDLTNNGVGIAENMDGTSVVGSTTMSALYTASKAESIKTAAIAASIDSSKNTWESALAKIKA